jgi:hypothetical protein
MPSVRSHARTHIHVNRRRCPSAEEAAAAGRSSLHHHSHRGCNKCCNCSRSVFGTVSTPRARLLLYVFTTPLVYVSWHARPCQEVRAAGQTARGGGLFPGCRRCATPSPATRGAALPLSCRCSMRLPSEEVGGGQMLPEQRRRRPWSTQVAKWRRGREEAGRGPGGYKSWCLVGGRCWIIAPFGYHRGGRRLKSPRALRQHRVWKSRLLFSVKVCVQFHHPFFGADGCTVRGKKMQGVRMHRHKHSLA